MIRKLIICTLLALTAYYLPRFCYDKTDGFKIANIFDNLPYNANWEVKNPPLIEGMDQKFSYLASGGQAYAFVSEDGKYVLKFFKHHLRRASPLVRYLPLPSSWRKKRSLHIQKRRKKLIRDFNSYKLAMENLRQETSLLYVQLNNSSSLDQTVTIVDKLGIEHNIPLDKVGFVLQEKAELAFPHLLQLVQKDQIMKAKEAIDSILDLIISRCEKGIYDEDARIHRNFGFIGNKAILIDVGRLKLDPSRKDQQVQKQDLYKITRSLRLYLKDICPQLADYLQETLDYKYHV